MFNRGQLILGALLVLCGTLFLIGTIFHFDIGAFCWPIGLIIAGGWLVLRPRFSQGSTTSDVVLLGDLRRQGSWTVQEGEIWLGVADVDLDFTQAVIPAGETRIKLYGFVGDVDLLFPTSAGVAVNASGFVVDANLFGRDIQTFLSPVQASSNNYAAAECRVRIDMVGFVTDIKVKQI
jgi:predicted membrane protein